MAFPRQEYWSKLPFPSPRDLPDPGIEARSPVFPALAGGFFAIAPSGKPWHRIGTLKKCFLIEDEEKVGCEEDGSIGEDL